MLNLVLSPKLKFQIWVRSYQMQRRYPNLNISLFNVGGRVPGWRANKFQDGLSVAISLVSVNCVPRNNEIIIQYGQGVLYKYLCFWHSRYIETMEYMSSL